MPGSATYVGNYGRPHVQMDIGSTEEVVVAHGSDNSAPAPATSGAVVSGAAYDPAAGWWGTSDFAPAQDEFEEATLLYCFCICPAPLVL